MSAPPPKMPQGTPTNPGHNTGGAHGATNSDDPDGQVTLPRPGSHVEVEARPELGLEGQVIRKNLLRRMFRRDVSPELIDERYILKQSIGKGAKGTVFLAEDGRLDRQLAIKLLHEHDSPIERTRLIREGQALAKLRHENIVQVYDAQNYEGQVYLAMEYIAGTTLRAWQREKRRGFRELLDAYRQAGAGLAAAHKAGFVHRDFKPENVLVEQATGRVCVVDFGLVKQGGGARPSITLESPGLLQATRTYQPKACDLRLTATHQAAGTPLYMSKEAFFLGHADEKSDQFSFCVALYLALYGHYPLTGTDPPASYADLVEAVDRGIIYAPPRGSKVPSWVFRVLARGMHVEAAERYPSMQALLADLDHGRRRRRGRQILVGALSFVFVGGLVAYVSSPRCGGAELFEKVWNDNTRVELQHAFAQTAAENPSGHFERAKGLMDGYAGDWASTYDSDVCQATWLRGQTLEAGVAQRRMGCLEARRTEFELLVAQLRNPSLEDVRNAALATAGLQSPTDCGMLGAGPPQPNAEQLPKVREAEAELAKAVVADALGAYQKAFDHATNAVEVAPRDYRPTRAKAYYQLAEEQVALGQGRAALASLEQGLNAAVPAKHLNALTTQIAALQLKVLSSPKLGASNGEKASYVEDYARRFAQSEDIPLRVTALVHKSIGLRAQFLGHDFKKALEAYETAYNLFVQLPGEHRREEADARMDMANAHLDLGQLAKAKVDYDAAYQIEVELSGEDHPRLAVHYANLANLYYLRGEFDKALEHAQKALELRKKIAGENGLAVAENHSLQLLLLEKLERYPEALELAYKRRKVVLRIPDADVRMRARALHDIARILWQQDKNHEAAEVQAQTLSIWTAGGVPQVPAERADYAIAIVLMANIKTDCADYEDADKFYREALDILRTVKDSDDLVAETLFNQGDSYKRRGDFQHAGSVLEQSLAMFQRRGVVSKANEVQKLLTEVKQRPAEPGPTSQPLTPQRNE